MPMLVESTLGLDLSAGLNTSVKLACHRLAGVTSKADK